MWLLSTTAMKYQFIERERKSRAHARWPVVVQCRVLEVHRSGYYAWQHQQRTHRLGKRALENHELSDAIREIHRRSQERYGAPRMTAALHQQGFCCSRNRVARLSLSHYHAIEPRTGEPQSSESALYGFGTRSVLDQ
jgi:hypothetical protein